MKAVVFEVPPGSGKVAVDQELAAAVFLAIAEVAEGRTAVETMAALALAVAALADQTEDKLHQPIRTWFCEMVAEAPKPVFFEFSPDVLNLMLKERD